MQREITRYLGSVARQHRDWAATGDEFGVSLI
jgi:hypothetical protein